jgi:hypothetical protein
VSDIGDRREAAQTSNGAQHHDAYSNRTGDFLLAAPLFLPLHTPQPCRNDFAHGEDAGEYSPDETLVPPRNVKDDSD